MMKEFLREKYKFIRKKISDDENKKISSIIQSRLLMMDEYVSAKLILLYAARDKELSMNKFARKALQDGKLLAFPKCLDLNGNMRFYLVKTMDDLNRGYFGLLEPMDYCMEVSTFFDSICIVPGLAFDELGYRLGYGKGYYDRFHREVHTVSIGVCMDCCVELSLPHDNFDKKMDFVVTERKFILCN